MLHSLLILIIVLSLLVFVHELGHFLTARFFKCRVEEFGFGYPPKIFGFKRGDTIYSINLIPLGGFVRIKGENGDTKDPDSFGSKPIGQRALMLSAGVLMNLVLAWVLLTIGFAVGLPQAIEDLPANARVRDSQLRVYSVIKNSPAAQVGLQSGDTVISIDGQTPMTVEQMRDLTAAAANREVTFVYRRDGQQQEVKVTPVTLAESGRAGIGIGMIRTGLVSYPIYIAPLQGLLATGVYLREIAMAFVDLFRGLFAEQRVAVEFSGPVGIAILTAEVSRAGFAYLIQFMAVLSVNLALINILPIPALDGGRMLFLVIERVRRRAVSARIEAFVHNIGFVALMTLVLVITYRDVVKFGDRIRDSISKIFGA